MLLPLLLLALLAADADGGTDMDAGVDAGPEQPARWSWNHADGGWLDDAGLTDELRLHVGEVAEVRFPLPVVLMQCDAPLIKLGATETTLLLTGADAGVTTCGFWFAQRAWPHRSMRVTVGR